MTPLEHTQPRSASKRLAFETTHGLTFIEWVSGGALKKIDGLLAARSWKDRQGQRRCLRAPASSASNERRNRRVQILRNSGAIDASICFDSQRKAIPQVVYREHDGYVSPPMDFYQDTPPRWATSGLTFTALVYNSNSARNRGARFRSFRCIAAKATEKTLFICS